MIRKVIKIAIFTAFVVLLTNLFDVAYSALFVKGGFVFNVKTDLVVPLFTGLAIGLFLYGRGKK